MAYGWVVGRVQPLRRIVGISLVGLLGLGAILAPEVLANSKRRRFGNDNSGRIHDPTRLRTPATGKAPGRFLHRPDVPEPEMPRSLRSSAVVPDPTPNLRGGTGFERRGKFFYRQADPPALTRRLGRNDYRALIPSPDQERVTRSSRSKSAASR